VIALLLGFATRSVTFPIGLLLAAGLAFGGLQVKHVLQVRGLNKQIAALEQTIATRDSTIAVQHIAISQERLNVTTLTARLKEQNRAIELLQASAKASEAVASAKALEALRAGEKAAEAIRSGHAHIEPGHAAVNQWLAERFAP
jgi:uncharacterized coiled-coil protein SlyX